MSEMLVDKHAAAVLEECDSFVEDRCILICFSSASFDVVNGAPVPVLDVYESCWFLRLGYSREMEPKRKSWLLHDYRHLQ